MSQTGVIDINSFNNFPDLKHAVDIFVGDVPATTGLTVRINSPHYVKSPFSVLVLRTGGNCVQVPCGGVDG